MKNIIRDKGSALLLLFLFVYKQSDAGHTSYTTYTAVLKKIFDETVENVLTTSCCHSSKTDIETKPTLGSLWNSETDGNLKFSSCNQMDL